MLYSRHYQLNTAGFLWDSAHVYEHLVILGAKKYLHDNGINQDLFGWITGATFENRLFIDAVFYRERSAELFDICMTDGICVSRRGVDEAVATVEAEERSCLVSDLDGLLESLRGLNQQKWNTEVAVESDLSSPELLLHPAAASFRDVSIIIGAESLSLEEQKVFLRLRPILQDIVSNHLSRNVVSYERGGEPHV